VVTTASLAQSLPDPSGHVIAVNKPESFKLLLAGGSPDVHDKEKIYCSIP
jgi:hypothetical protein